MSRALPVRVTRIAADQIKDAAAWWAKNRPAAPDAIAEELESALALLALQPNLGAAARNIRLRGVRRIHLSRVHYHVYYRVSSEAIDVLAFWHTSRGSGPALV